MLTRIRRRFAALKRAERGAVTMMTVFFFIGIAVVLGLAVDTGRAYSERQRLQAWLDSVAVSAAAELDGEADAIARADWIIEQAGLIQSGLWSEGGGFSVAAAKYLSEAPEGGLDGLTAGEIEALTTADPREAEALVLLSDRRAVRWTALNLLSDAEARGRAFEVDARSVAVPVRERRCGVPRLAICSSQGDIDDIARPGVQLRIDKNLDGLWLEGEYGLITAGLEDPSGACDAFTGPERLTCLLAVDELGGACPAELELSAGDGVDVSGALNVRFDIWADSVPHLHELPEISSDVNTLSGDLYACNGAQYDVVSDSMGLPDDPCFHNGSCAWAGLPVDFESLQLYWAENHGGDIPGDANIATRHDMYLHEILENLLDPEGPEDSSVNACNANAAPRPGRRVLDVAFVDCTQLAGLDVEDAPVLAHAEVLMTAPATHTASYIATFDGSHQNEWMGRGDIVGQAWTGEVQGNPGNDRAVGSAGETPDGGGGWGGGTRGRSDGDDEVFAQAFRMDRDGDGAGSNDGDFTEFELGEVTLTDGPIGITLVGERDTGEWVRIDRIRLRRPGPDVWIEAEDMDRDAFEVVNGDEASGGRLVRLPGGTGVLTTETEVEAGTYRVYVYAQDENDGRSDVSLSIRQGEVAHWPAEDLRVIDDQGRLTYDPYRHVGLMRIEAKQSVSATGSRDPWQSVAMLFDTTDISGGDSDLASTRFGNVLIVSEDGDAGDPDDEAQGGWLVFHFDRPTRIDSVTVFDTEKGGVIRVYDHVQPDPTGEFETRSNGSLNPMRGGEEHDPNELAHFAVPRLGDGKHVRMRIDTENVRTFAYFLPDSGAMDNLEFHNDLTDPVIDDRVMLEVIGVSSGAEAIRAVLYD